MVSASDWVIVIGMLLTGSINTISKKFQNNQEAHGEKFSFPFLQTTAMFIGESLCVFFLIFLRFRMRRKVRKEEEATEVTKPLTEEDKKILNLPKPSFIFTLFALCDLTGTTLSGIGLLWVDASVFQMLRGSLIVFAALLRRIFRKKKLHAYQIVGLFTVVFSLTLVGYASILDSQSDSDGEDTDSFKTGLAEFLIVFGMLANAIQMVLEEVYVTSGGYHPVQVVGLEGVSGFVLAVCIALPLCYYIPGDSHGNHYENALKGIEILSQYKMILFLMVLYILSISLYNTFGLLVTRKLSTVHRTLLDACRTTIVWTFMLGIDHFTNGDVKGEQGRPTHGSN
eukprot:TRINITY_DN2455_c0_g1_i2.p1 TRINITY_DN2455_c0_g1~~TRINITY_DN2455_c0_g1_i2.p1  ORF type:complete len:340 (-),score=77.25 TRINITY_DN2455_c0_g1_i2:218-1237(-)